VRNDAVHILDYKPGARTNKPRFPRAPDFPEPLITAPKGVFAPTISLSGRRDFFELPETFSTARP
jgi:hypothetical protein